MPHPKTIQVLDSLLIVEHLLNHDSSAFAVVLRFFIGKINRDKNSVHIPDPHDDLSSNSSRRGERIPQRITVDEGPDEPIVDNEYNSHGLSVNPDPLLADPADI